MTPHPISQPAARARQVGGGGGGAGMLVWTLVGTVSSLAATYFIVKEMRKADGQAGGRAIGEAARRAHRGSEFRLISCA